MANALPFKEWLERVPCHRSHESFIRAVCGEGFPFKWWDVATLQFSLKQYSRLCHDDPCGVGKFATPILFELANAYDRYVLALEEDERECTITRMKQKLSERTKNAEALTLKKKKKRESGKEKKKVTAPIAAFPAWVSRILRDSHGTDFNAAFEAALSAGCFAEKRMRGNTLEKTITHVGKEFATTIRDLYAQYINSPSSLRSAKYSEV